MDNNLNNNQPKAPQPVHQRVQPVYQQRPQGYPSSQQSRPVQNQPYYNNAQHSPYVQAAPYIPNYGLPKKVHKPFEKKDNIFLFIFLACSFLLVDFAFFHGFHLGFTISYFIIFIVSSIYLFKKGNKLNVFSLICGGISLAGAITFTLYSNVFINTIMVILIAGLFTIYCLGISSSFKRAQGNFKMLFDLFRGALIDPLENIGDVLGSMKAGADKGKKHLSAIIGILIAIPVLVVIVPLLIQSDAAFEGLISSIAKNIGIYLAELAISVILLPFVFSFMFGKRNKINKLDTATNTSHKSIPAAGCISFLSVISLTYVVYLFSQLAYFFSAFQGFLPEGYTKNASAFARRGFYEMFAICAINIVIISLINFFSKRRTDGKVSLAIKLLSLFISLFSVILIISAMQKMRLNISTYGFTRNRLLIAVFMLMMLVVIAFFIIHIFAPKVPYMQPIIIICSIMFVALSFSNIDEFTYNSNLKAYQNGNIKNFDITAVSNLNPSEEYLVRLIKSDDKGLAHNAKKKLVSEIYYNETKLVREDEGTFKFNRVDFREYCFANYKAQKSLKAYFDEMSPEEKDSFDRLYALYDNENYFQDYDYIYDTESDKAYRYNEKTDRYDIEFDESELYEAD